MPITQTTLLGLYGTLRALILINETTATLLAGLTAYKTIQPLRDAMLEAAEVLKLASAHAEQEAIAIVLHDGEGIKINPITGAAE
jgi:hypothetical protein